MHRTVLVLAMLLLAATASRADAPAGHEDYCYWLTLNGRPSDKPPFYCATYNDQLRVPGSPSPVTGAADSADARDMLRRGNAAFIAGKGEEAVTWIRKAADARDPIAMGELADLYERGTVVGKDLVQMAALHQAAADLGSPYSMFELGLLYGQGVGVARDDAAAARWLLKAAGLGEVGAMAVLADHYRNGAGVKKSGSEAVRWLKLAYAGGDRIGTMRALGEIHDRGDGIKADPALALHWYRLSAQAGERDSWPILARMYREGRGTARDAEQADYWDGKLTAPSFTGNNDYCQWLVSSGTPQSIWCLKRDLRLVTAPSAPVSEADADAGEPRAMLLFAHSLFFKGDGAGGLAWLQKAAAAGQTDAMTELGHLLANGLLVEKDTAAAEGWFKAAAARGSAVATAELGSLATSGPAKDDAAATRWFVQAAAMGDPSSMLTAGIRYKNGNGVTPDAKEAARLLRLAYANGEGALAAHELAELCDNGPSPDPAQAFHWYRLAAELGDPSSMTALARLYRAGRGVEQDPEQADYWTAQARQHAPPMRVVAPAR